MAVGMTPAYHGPAAPDHATQAIPATRRTHSTSTTMEIRPSAGGVKKRIQIPRALFAPLSLVDVERYCARPTTS